MYMTKAKGWNYVSSCAQWKPLNHSENFCVTLKITHLNADIRGKKKKRTEERKSATQQQQLKGGNKKRNKKKSNK